MAKIDLTMPKLGESIMEATILKWNKKVGDKIEQDETILEIATDKVDSIVPSEVEGVMAEILFAENDVVPIGSVIARIETAVGAPKTAPPPQTQPTAPSAIPSNLSDVPLPPQVAGASAAAVLASAKTGESTRFYSPLVKTIAKEENIHLAELEAIPGTGQNGRVTKTDVLKYVNENKKGAPAQKAPPAPQAVQQSAPAMQKPATSMSGGVEIVEMDRMRKLIADHMVMSKQTSPHVTSFIEADVTNLVQWRNRIKNDYQNRYNENITFTPIFIEAVVKAIKDFPMINISVEGTKILVKKDINIGMAAALPSGALIVPVIKNADFLNLAGLTKAVNDLANRARANQLKPDEIQNGTFTLTNVGTFGNVMGTPIINQPQVAILATGAIRKRPAVLETEHGDVIAIRQMMFLSLSYDHRVVDGFLGGSFLKKIADYLEGFDVRRSI